MSEANEGAGAGTATGRDRGDAGADGDEAAGRAEASARAKTKADTPGRGAVALGKHVTIDATQRLDALDRPSARAYPASDSRTPNQSVYALVCASAQPPRLDALGPISRVSGLPLVTPVDWGPVNWAPADGEGAGERRYALIFEHPSAEPLAASSQAAITPMREEPVVERVLRPILRILRDLDSRGLTHRAISADNLFGSPTGGGGLMLGECVSAPAGMLQPVVYEPIDSAQALPAGRGAGTMADDLYALGVLIAVLLRGGDPTFDVEPYKMIARKIQRGSYATLLEDTRVSLKLMEPLRGLLCDRLDERWTLNDLDYWLNGRHQSPQQPSLPAKARRGFPFNGAEYWTCPGLAHALANAWPEALRAVADGELERWAARSLTDDKQAKALQATLAGGRSKEGHDMDRVLASTLIELDPPGPIRLRDFAARLDALPQVLAVDYHDDTRRNAFVRMLTAKLPQRWLDAQAVARPDQPQVVQLFERMLWYLERDRTGYGLERVLYQFNDGWPCQSPLVAAAFVSDVADLLPALEARAQQGIPDASPVDRHIAAFCGASLSPAPDRLLQSLGHTDAKERALAALNLLADLQRRYGPQRLPALSEWTARHVEPLAQSLHNRQLRERVERQVERAVKSGSLLELRSALADHDMRQRDDRGFANAKADYARTAREIAWLEDGGLTSDAHIAHATRTAATAISAVCSGLLVVLLTVFYAS